MEIKHKKNGKTYSLYLQRYIKGFSVSFFRAGKLMYKFLLMEEREFIKDLRKRFYIMDDLGER